MPFGEDEDKEQPDAETRIWCLNTSSHDNVCANFIYLLENMQPFYLDFCIFTNSDIYPLCLPHLIPTPGRAVPN